MIGQARQDTITKECVQGKVGVTTITEKMIESHLRCYRHMWRRLVKS